MLRKTNIERKLAQARKDQAGSLRILDQFYEVLRLDASQEKNIEKNLREGNSVIENVFNLDLLDSENIYHIDHIRTICIDYRLRFLSSKYFKGQIPSEAISKIKMLEKVHGTTIGGFKILAPSRLFKLEDKDDPLLFSPLGNDYYYLIHKWGEDLHPLRKLLVWPFKNVVNLVTLLILVSYAGTFLIPEGLFSKSSSSAEFWIMFFFIFKSITAIVIFYGFAMGKNFNPAIWKSKYYNA